MLPIGENAAVRQKSCHWVKCWQPVKNFRASEKLPTSKIAANPRKGCRPAKKLADGGKAAYRQINRKRCWPAEKLPAGKKTADRLKRFHGAKKLPTRKKDRRKRDRRKMCLSAKSVQQKRFGKREFGRSGLVKRLFVGKKFPARSLPTGEKAIDQWSIGK
jgi:hypothetical protein